MNSATWEPLWDGLPSLRHVGFDLPGHGTNTEPMPGDLAAVADQLAASLRATGSDTVVAMSFGSAVALELAIRYPDACSRLVVCAPTLSGPFHDEAAAVRMKQIIHQVFAGATPEALADAWLAEPSPIFDGLRSHPEAFAAVRAAVRAHAWREMRTPAMGTILQHPHTPELLARIRAEVHVVVGDKDMPRFLANAETLREHAVKATVEVWEGCGHLPFLEDSARAVSFLRTVLACGECPPETSVRAREGAAR